MDKYDLHKNKKFIKEMEEYMEKYGLLSPKKIAKEMSEYHMELLKEYGKKVHYNQWEITLDSYNKFLENNLDIMDKFEELYNIPKILRISEVIKNTKKRIDEYISKSCLI